MKSARWSAMLTMGLLFLMVVRATPQSEEADRSGITNPAWSALAASMEKMHSEMMSVRQSNNSDVDFVRLMLPHHQAAIDMARAQLLCGKDPQMRQLAQEIIADQESEIELMKLWLKQRGVPAKSNQTVFSK